jgi:hypothetical protein
MIRGLAGTITAAVLASITLWSFWVLQNYGPDSSIRRFHEAAVKLDRAELAAVTWGDPNSAAAIRLQQTVRAWLTGGATFRIARKQETRGVLTAAVIYSRPGAPSMATVWVLRRQQGESGWRVDAPETLMFLQRRLF